VRLLFRHGVGRTGPTSDHVVQFPRNPSGGFCPAGVLGERYSLLSDTVSGSDAPAMRVRAPEADGSADSGARPHPRLGRFSTKWQASRSTSTWGVH
jgi:hypothetical protein